MGVRGWGGGAGSSPHPSAPPLVSSTHLGCDRPGLAPLALRFPQTRCFAALGHPVIRWVPRSPIILELGTLYRGFLPQVSAEATSSRVVLRVTRVRLCTCSRTRRRSTSFRLVRRRSGAFRYITLETNSAGAVTCVPITRHSCKGFRLRRPRPETRWVCSAGWAAGVGAGGAEGSAFSRPSAP